MFQARQEGELAGRRRRRGQDCLQVIPPPRSPCEAPEDEIPPYKMNGEQILVGMEVKGLHT